ncbi:hypothetical protein [Pseudonocardia acaciae]|uniref:hypothetical protein n=1 Tax=Pseudonocardia acaciae TaxID=551276 RepID=UPI0012EDDBDD|nr:hypothetical protein [Pseudonocardia acaciae]
MSDTPSEREDELRPHIETQETTAPDKTDGRAQARALESTDQRLCALHRATGQTEWIDLEAKRQGAHDIDNPPEAGGLNAY